MSFRIPKKVRTEDAAGAPSGAGGASGSGGSSNPPNRNNPPIRFTTPSSSGSSYAKTFTPIGKCEVQTNVFKVDITKLPFRLTRLSMETTLCGGKVDVNLTEGHQAVSGGVNDSERRLALHTVFLKLFQRHPDIFGTDILQYTYDCANTIYGFETAYKGGDAKLEDKIERKDFSDKEWEMISRILRRQSMFFKVILSANGFVYSDGPNALSNENRQELTRVVENCSSEVLNTTDYLQYGSQTFPMNEPPVFKPDATTEIRCGFDKAVRLAEGLAGTPEIVVTIDTKLSPFFSATSTLKFFCSKYAEFKGVSTGSQPGTSRGNRPGDRGGDRRGFGGRDPRADQRRRSRSRSPIRRDEKPVQDDWNYNEVKEIQSAYERGTEKNLLGRIEEALKGLLVVPIHLPKDKNRNIIVSRIAGSNAMNSIFELNKGKDDARNISVADYFKEKYNYQIKFPHLPLVVSGRLKNETFMPLELLNIVPGQRIKIQKMSANVQASMTGQNATLPRDHVLRIREILKGHLKIENNPHLKKFGIHVAREPIQMEAMMLSPAQMIFANRAIVVPPPGTVQFRQNKGQKYYKPAKINNVAVVNFDGAVTNLEIFSARLHATCLKNGLEMRKSHQEWLKYQWNSNDASYIKAEMVKMRDAQITIIVAITPEKKPDVHDVLKYFEASAGLQTIQIHINTADCFVRDAGGAQTVDNVMRKLNLKCGGINYLVEIPQSYDHKVVCSNVSFVQQKLFAKTQFVGFEMTHGPSRTLYDRVQGTFDGEPTVVGCSYSLKAVTDLGGFHFLQERNEYKLKNLDSKITVCLEQYKKSAGALPEVLLVYRTGAGEGDFKRVEEEVQDMRKALEKVGSKSKLVVVVVQKTSHTRIFPKEIKGNKPVEQNVKSGTCIDGQITSAGRQEFVLVCQSALIGTVRPVKYTIVANDPAWSKNEMAHLTYFLAFGHQVSYQPPAIPHVLYAADNLAKRGRNNFLQHKKLGLLTKSIKKVLAEHKDLAVEGHEAELDSLLVESITDAMNKMAVKNRSFWA
ncbi:hypothetical protein CRE_06564 [Caenorhabditis remanei]|uniref:Piwi domain-containing protein n=1 Tax=Caenorhabditis remanei TaxID=31234 RepID=E3M1J8_CAERE|nr:hypothetical protein CRE_06564 [Caenorhabditis remanei]